MNWCLVSAVTLHNSNTLFYYLALFWFWKWLCSHWLGGQPCYKWWCEGQIWVTFCKYTSMKTLMWVWAEAALQAAAGCWLGCGGLNLCCTPGTPAVGGGPPVAAVVSPRCSGRCSKCCYISLCGWGRHLAVHTVQPKDLSWVPSTSNMGLLLHCIEWPSPEVTGENRDLSVIFGFFKCTDSSTVAL